MRGLSVFGVVDFVVDEDCLKVAALSLSHARQLICITELTQSVTDSTNSLDGAES
jgi:hypothetical protein